MGKLIPSKTQTLPAKPTPHASVPPGHLPGPLEVYASDFKAFIKEVESRYDLDELDRMARRYARTPASGAAEALNALARIVRDEPEAFTGSEVNLDAERLDGIADRERGLVIIREATMRLLDLLKDSWLEQADEIVELLTIGYQRLKQIDKGRLFSNDRLATAAQQLDDYHERVVLEGANKGEVDREVLASPKRSAKRPQRESSSGKVTP